MMLSQLVERLDDVFFERASLAFREAAGLHSDSGPRPSLPDEVLRTDALKLTEETLASPRVDEAKKARLVLLRRFLLHTFVEERGAAQTHTVARFERQHTFSTLGRVWTLREALAHVATARQRHERLALTAAIAEGYGSQAAHLVERLRLMGEGLEVLGMTRAALVEAIHGRPLEPRLAAARSLLKETADAHRDLLAFAFQKSAIEVERPTALEGDVEYACSAPWLHGLFRKEDVLHAVTRCIFDVGLTPNAEGRLTVDTDSHSQAALCFELRVPGQIRLLLRAQDGLRSYGQWLRAWGTALHRAHVGPNLPFVERRLGDTAVIEAVGVLFASFLQDEGWLKRYLRLTNHQAREAARHTAAFQLLAIRRAAAMSVFSTHFGEGTWASLSESYAQHVKDSTGGQPIAELAFKEIDVFGENLLRLDAYALSHALRTSLRERFNEDFWRNPATGKWLAQFAQNGQRDDALHVAMAYGKSSLDVAEATQECIRTLSA